MPQRRFRVKGAVGGGLTLHTSAARGDMESIEKHLANGIPADLLAADGLAPLHWALASDDSRVIQLLVSRGSPGVDVR